MDNMNTAIILAAGKATRMKAGINKQYLNLKGKPLLSYALEVFFTSKLIDEIILVINEKEQDICHSKVLNHINIEKPFKLVFGGEERKVSVYNGLKNIDIKTNIIVIHDGARPFITEEMIETCVAGAKKYKAVSFGVPIKDTVKTINDKGFVLNTLDRKKTWLAQTPQGFEHELILKAHEKVLNCEKVVTDDAMLVENLPFNVKMILGEYRNIKITTIEDLAIAEALISGGINV